MDREYLPLGLKKQIKNERKGNRVALKSEEIESAKRAGEAKQAFGETRFYFFSLLKKLVRGLAVVGALFVRSRRGRGGTSPQLQSFKGV